MGTGASGSANLGTSVALSADGNTALVGGLSDNTGVGAAWVFTRSSSGWVQQGAKLVPSGAIGAANFGKSVALSSDGNTALIGGPDDNATTVQGAAWVFTRSAGAWSQQGAKLVPTGAVGYPRVGYSVALSADGNTALMGAETDDYTIGAAFVFTRSGSTWSQQGSKLVGSGAVGDAEQGNAVALSSDGNTALIGGFADNSLVGAAWVFTRSGTTWTQQGAKLVGIGAVGTAFQGFSVALSGDGATALVGGFEDNTYVGAAWVFTLSGGIWSQQGSKLVGTGYVGEATMGSSVALSANGNIALVGGSGDHPNGAVWVFTRSGVTWTQQGAKLVGSGSSGNSTSQGASVALSPTTNAAYTAITGGPGDASGVGAAWVFAVPVLTVVAPPAANAETAFNVTVNAEDTAGAFVTGYNDLLQFTSTDGSAILPADSTLTNGTGLFAVTLLTAGNQTVTATDTVYPGIAATSGEVLVTPSGPQPPTLSKAFGAPSIPLNTSTTLTFTITNPNAALNLTGIGFTDTMPAGLGVTLSAGPRAKPRGTPGVCNGTLLASGGVVSLSGATLLSGASCTISVNVTGTAAGTMNNVTSAVTSTEGGTGLTASATLIVVAPPSLAKTFAVPSILVNGTTTLSFVLTNPAANTVALTGVSFTDTFPAGLLVATPNGIANYCGGSFTAVAGTGTATLIGATIATSSACSLSVTVTANASGLYTNSTAPASTNGGAGGTSVAHLGVAAPPAITKTFGAASIPMGGSTSLGFVLTNPAANTIPLTGVAFTDNLPPGLVVATPSGLTSTCGGTVVAVAGGGSVSLSGATLAVSGSCALSLNVTGIAAGAQNNSVTVTSTEGGTGNTSNASVTVVSPPVFAKSFGQVGGPAQIRKPLDRPHGGGGASIPVNGTAQLTFFLGNSNAATTLTGVSFSDALPAGVVVSTPNGLGGTCLGGTVTAVPGSGSVSLIGQTLLANTNCTISLSVTGTAAGTKNNVTGAITSNEGGTGVTASSTLYVVAPPAIAKAFGAPAIALNGTTSLILTLTNPAADTVAENSVAFTDTFPVGLEVATPDGLVNTCGGTATAAAGSGVVSLSEGTIAVSSSCTVTVNVTGTVSGAYTNTTGAVSSGNGGTGVTATANLAVAAPPAITKTFGAASIPISGSTSLGFVLTNPAANTIPLTGAAFTDNLPAGLVVATPSGLTSTCGGAPSAAPGGTSVSLSGTTLAVSGSCALSLNVTGIAAGIQNNSVQATSNEGGAGNTSNASLTVTSPPTLIKSFGNQEGPASLRKRFARPHDGGPQSTPLNVATQLTFYIFNQNATSSLTGVAFTDTFPSGLVVASPSGLSNPCNSTIVATPGAGSVSFSAGTMVANSECIVSLNVTGTTAGTKNNVTGAISSNEGGVGLTASATLIVVAPPAIAKAFGAPSIPLNGTTSLTFTLTNPVANTEALAGVAFTDTFPVGLEVATPDGLVSTCGGTATAVAGSGVVSLSEGTIAASSSCTVTVNVTGTASGAYTNTTGAVASTNGGAGTTATASLAVASPPAITKTFGAATIPQNGSTSLAFVLVNPAINTIPLAGLAFTDNLPAGMVVASPSGLTSTCGGTPAAAADGSSVNLSGGTLAAGASCTLSLNVTGVAAGTANNSVTVTSTTAGAGNTSTASLVVLAPPAILISFGAASIPLNGTATLTFNLSNSNPALALTGIAFTDALPTGLVVASPNGLTNTCGGTPAAAPGGGSVSLSGATLAANGSCSFSVNVTGTTGGTKTNVTSAPVSNQGGTGLPASAVLNVEAPPSLAVHFGAAGVPLNGVTSLSYTITNPAANTVPLTGVAFTDAFPPDLLVASPNGLSNTCGGAAVAVSGSGSVSLSGATVAAGSSCTLAVNVTVTATAAYTSGLTAVASANGGTGNAASATLTVLVPIAFNAPAGLSIEVDGATHTGDVTLLLAFSSSHTISVVTPQAGTPGTQYIFNTWSDGGAVSHTITVTASPATYTATFTTQYQLTLTVTPTGSGTITPVSGGFYNAGASVTLTAVASPGYAFHAWTGAANPSGSATAAILMSGPENVTAGFQATGGVSPPAIGGVLNGGSFLQGLAAPNTILSLFGTNLSCTPAPQVLVNGVQTQVLFSSDTQINFVIPAGLAGTGNASVQIVCNGVSSQPGTLALSPVNPSIFTQTENGTGQGAILNVNYSVNGVQWPGVPGSYLLVFGTGFGDLGPAGADGLQRLLLPVTALIGGVAAQVVYAGEAPFFTSGLQQINILIPDNAPAGNAVPIQLVVGGVSTQSGVTVVIQ